MEIKFFCPRWGSENMPWDDFCLSVVNAGFDGVETPVPLDEKEKNEISAAIKTHGLLLIGQFYQSFEKVFDKHHKDFKKHLENIVGLKPILIDSQTGKDYFTANQNQLLFELAKEITNETGVPIAHETHRNKALFAAHIAKSLLVQNPEVLITADFSHWCNVSESLLEQQQEAIEIAVSRAIHIHARVGHSQAAQITDPRAPEWHNEVEAHLAWWDQIVEHRSKSGADLLTITPEFGPAPYMPALPYTSMPLADQWGINVYMLNLLKTRYKNF